MRVPRRRPKLIRFSADELRVVGDRAAASGRPFAVYVREAALGSPARARPGAGNDALVRALSRLASRLAQLGRAAREQGLPGAAEFERELGAVLTIIRDAT